MARCHCGFTNAESETDYVVHLHCVQCGNPIVQQAEGELAKYAGYEVGLTFWKMKIEPFDHLELLCKVCALELSSWMKMKLGGHLRRRPR